jgi:hypothetical protein
VKRFTYTPTEHLLDDGMFINHKPAIP